IKDILDSQGKLASAIPVEGKEQASLRGIETITAKANVAQVCYKILKEQNKDHRLKMEMRLEAIKGCWRGREASGLALPEIFIESDVTAVHNGLIPMVVYSVTEMYFDGLLARTVVNVGDDTKAAFSDTEKSLATFYEEFSGIRDSLTADFIADLTALGMTDT